MNILHLSTYLQGGAGRVLVDLVRSQSRKGHHVEVVISQTEYSGYENYSEYLNDLEELNVDLFKVDSLFKRDAILNESVVQFLMERLPDSKYDIVHAHASIPAMIGKRSVESVDRHIPVIQTMHGWGLNKTPDQELQDVAILNGLDQVIAVSTSARDLLLRKGIVEEQLTVVPNGVTETSELGVQDCDVEILDKVTSDRFVIGTIGTLCERKNQVVLFHAVSNLIKQGVDCALVIIGDGEDFSKYDQLAKELGIESHVSVLGYRSNPRAYLNYFDVFCLPTLSEGGTPLAIMECFCDKTLVVASDIREVTAMVKEGVTGLLVDPNSHLDVAQKLHQVFDMDSSEKRKIRDCARNLFEEKYALNSMTESYERIYHSLIGED